MGRDASADLDVAGAVAAGACPAASSSSSSGAIASGAAVQSTSAPGAGSSTPAPAGDGDCHGGAPAAPAASPSAVAGPRAADDFTDLGVAVGGVGGGEGCAAAEGEAGGAAAGGAEGGRGSASRSGNRGADAAEDAEDAFNARFRIAGFGGPDDELRTPAVKDLEALDDEYLAIEKEHEADHLVLLRQYEEKIKHLLDWRASLLNSCIAEDGLLPQRVAFPPLPGFWRSVLQNSVEFEQDIERHDEPVLDYLADIRRDWLDDNCRDKGFRIRFNFASNPYFTNELLDKTFHTELASKYSDRLECTRIESTVVDWRPGRNVTVEVVSKKPKGSRRRGGKMKKEEVPRRSFFRTFFRNLGPDEQLPEEELDEEDEQDVMDCLLEDDYAQGVALRDHMIPRAIRWFTGEACEDEENGSASGEEGSGSDDGDEDDEEEDGDDDDDDSEDEEATRRGGRGGARGSKGGPKAR